MALMVYGMLGKLNWPERSGIKGVVHKYFSVLLDHLTEIISI